MSMEDKDIPVIAPDGTPGFMPAANFEKAAKAGYRRGSVLISPSGEEGILPTENTMKALQAGYKMKGTTQPFTDRAMPADVQLKGPMSTRDKLMGMLKRTALAAPEIIGGTGGGILGLAAGGPPGAIAGATIGGSGGRALSNIAATASPSLGQYATNMGQAPPTSSMDAAEQVGWAGIKSGVAEAAGMGIAKIPRLAVPLKQSAEKSMSQALGATTRANKELSAKVVPELLDRRVTALTRKSLEKKSAGQLDNAGDELNDALNAVPAGTPTNTQNVLDELRSYRHSFVVNGVPVDQQAVRDIDEMAELVNDLGPNVSHESLRKVRTILDKKVYSNEKVLGKTATEGTTVMVQKEAADAMRRELAAVAPDVAKINAEYSFWKNVNRIVGETNKRTASQSTPMGEQILTGAGATGGFAKGGIVGGIEGALVLGSLRKVITSTAWRTTSAVVKNELADALASNNIKKVFQIMGTITSTGARTAGAVPAEVQK